ncbi:MAG: pyridoxal 5'-phosphate synthase glutaminase subunit PdxT [Actinomycetales bacterium]|nr:pyridoxal 5'-phosphate synthase glutaminase subunit PdxT [Actinomycetales bacterium]
MSSPSIGVLALQGDFREHMAALGRLGVDALEVRRVAELERCDGLIIPGGESTVMQRLAEAYDLFEPIRDAIRAGLPVFGTCAGLIMLADRIQEGIVGQRTFGGLDVTVRRNAFGNQLDSFEADLAFRGIDGPVHAAFIRGPVIQEVGSGVEILSQLHDGRIVGVRQGQLLGISFHPEVTGEDRIHRLFLDMVTSR